MLVSFFLFLVTCIGRQHVMPFDRRVADFSWLLAHGVVLTADRLRPSFPLETAGHLFFECPLAQNVLAWVQSLLVLAVPSAPSLCLRHVLFGFDIAEFTIILWFFPI